MGVNFYRSFFIFVFISLIVMLNSCSGTSSSPYEGRWINNYAVTQEDCPECQGTALFKVDEDGNIEGRFYVILTSGNVSLLCELKGSVDKAGNLTVDKIESGESSESENSETTSVTGKFSKVTATGTLVFQFSDRYAFSYNWKLYKNDPYSRTGYWLYYDNEGDNGANLSFSFGIMINEYGEIINSGGSFYNNSNQRVFFKITGDLDSSGDIVKGQIELNDTGDTGTIMGRFDNTHASGKISIPAITDMELSWDMTKIVE